MFTAKQARDRYVGYNSLIVGNALEKIEIRIQKMCVAATSVSIKYNTRTAASMANLEQVMRHLVAAGYTVNKRIPLMGETGYDACDIELIISWDIE